jgi:hypothetical protein
VGTEAYADYVNAQGGINGRKIVVDSSDDQYSGPPNKQETQADVDKDFAMVGGFSLFDNFGGAGAAGQPAGPQRDRLAGFRHRRPAQLLQPGSRRSTAGSSGPWPTSRKFPGTSPTPAPWSPTSPRPDQVGGREGGHGP